MESNAVITQLKNLINQLKQINITSLSLPEERTPEIEEKETLLIRKIVGCFDEILSNKFNLKNLQIKESLENKSNYWTFISQHFNNPLVHFCIINDHTESANQNEEENLLQKGENWIYLSILEKSFSDSINEIYHYKLDELYYEKDSILRKYRIDIIQILDELKQIQFVHIKNKDYVKYLEYLSKNTIFIEKDKSEFYSKTPESPIFENATPPSHLIFSDISMIPFLKNIDIDNNDIDKSDYYYAPDFESNINIADHKNAEDEKEFICEKKADFAPKVIDNFYTFTTNLNENNKKHNNIINEESLSNENKNKIIFNKKSNNISIENMNSILDKISNEDSNSSKFSEEEPNSNHQLILNPKISRFLPTDNLYEINEKTKEYNKNDKLIYKKKKRPISNCLLLYLNNYYKKAPYHKFYKHNLHNRPISLKEQNYQCYICYKKFSFICDIPLEPIFWCSYYMRFVCKKCIDDEYSIIPYFVLEKWVFQKFSISKKAKNILLEWYNKPVIYFKKYDKLLKKIRQLNEVIEIKEDINNIFDYMKCENKFQFLKDNLGEYEYLVLKEYLFSMRDLVEINNKTFYEKIDRIKKRFVKHISGECPKCKYDGEICSKCGFNEKIYFYDSDKVFYCKVCRKSFHKRCKGLIEHVH